MGQMQRGTDANAAKRTSMLARKKWSNQSLHLRRVKGSDVATGQFFCAQQGKKQVSHLMSAAQFESVL